MGLKYHLRVATLVAALVPMTASGCGTSTTAAPAGPSPAAGGLPAACLTEQAVGAAVGFTVHVERSTIKSTSEAVTCTFMADDQTARPGANVTLLVAPKAYAPQALSDITDSADRAQTKAASVAIGQNGLVYESAQRSAAATVIDGKLVAVTVDGMGLSDAGAGKNAVVALLGQVAAKVGG